MNLSMKLFAGTSSAASGDLGSDPATFWVSAPASFDLGGANKGACASANRSELMDSSRGLAASSATSAARGQSNRAAARRGIGPPPGEVVKSIVYSRVACQPGRGREG